MANAGHITRRTMLHGSLLASLAVPTAQAHPQPSRLETLGSALEKSWAAETAADPADFSMAFERTVEIVRQIECEPATSLADLQVKGRAVAWCYQDDDGLPFVDKQTTDVRLMRSIINDLLNGEMG